MIRFRKIICNLAILIVIVNCGAEECEKETDFMCRHDKKCIDAALMCDKRFDCDDQSDEENCGKKKQKPFF